MGAEWFEQYANGKTMKEAFIAGVEEAAWEYGHRGYTGSMAEKHEFVDMTADFPKFSTIDELNAIMDTIKGISNVTDDNKIEDWENGKWVKRAATDKEKAVLKVARAAFEKWGPAVGIKLPDGFNEPYLFFGLASS